MYKRRSYGKLFPYVQGFQSKTFTRYNLYEKHLDMRKFSTKG